MHQFHGLMRRVLQSGKKAKNDRTGEQCNFLVGETLRFDLADGFPAITTKKLAFNACKGELLGFFRGYTSAADFRALGCKIWDANANETEGWLANPARKGTDDLGLIYGAQWTDWRDTRVCRDYDEFARLRAVGYTPLVEGVPLIPGDPRAVVYVVERRINQLEAALRKLKSDPSDRRIIVSGWNVAELDRMALPPCHMDYRFVARGQKLDVVMTIRSWDLFLGGPFNIASTALFLSIMAQLAGFESGEVIIQATNAHLYATHFEAVEEQLSRPHFESPQLLLQGINPVRSSAEVVGAFARIEPQQICLLNYQSHDAIPARMAA